MQKTKWDVWVGLLVVIGFAAITFLSLKAANLLQVSWGDSYRVTARFENIGGLKPQAAVKSAGVVVGRVESIRLDMNTYQASVVLKMDSEFQFPSDSSLKILTSGLLGERYVGVQAGYATQTWQGGEMVTQTQSAVVLENLISQFLFNQTAAKVDASK